MAFAELLETRLAVRTCPAGVDEASHAYDIADLKLRYFATRACYVPDDFVTGNHGVCRLAPLPAYLVNVGMTYAAIVDLKKDIVRAGFSAGELKRFERRCRALSGIAACYRHGIVPLRIFSGSMVNIARIGAGVPSIFEKVDLLKD
jgi:hypothetical protein